MARKTVSYPDRVSYALDNLWSDREIFNGRDHEPLPGFILERQCTCIELRDCAARRRGADGISGQPKRIVRRDRYARASGFEADWRGRHEKSRIVNVALNQESRLSIISSQRIQADLRTSKCNRVNRGVETMHHQSACPAIEHSRPKA